MRNLYVTKTEGPDGISNWILKECNEILSAKLQTILMCSINKGKVPGDWKKANIVPIYKDAMERIKVTIGQSH